MALGRWKDGVPTLGKGPILMASGTRELMSPAQSHLPDPIPELLPDPSVCVTPGVQREVGEGGFFPGEWGKAALGAQPA